MNDPHPNGLTVLGLAAVALRRRRLIFVVWGTVVLAAIAVASFRRPEYSVRFSFVPQSAPDPSRAGLASLAGQFGVSLGAAAAGGQPSQFYADLLTAREVLVPIVTPPIAVEGVETTVAEVLRLRVRDDARRTERLLRAMRTKVLSTSVATRTTGVVSVQVRTPHPDASLAIAERVVQQLNDFNLRTRRSQAAEERRFVAAQLAEARDSLRLAEDSLERFVRTNRDLASAPRLELEYERRQREVALRQQAVGSLTQALQEARIREVRDTPVLTVIDRPVRPVDPDPRGRLVLLAGALAGGLLAGLVVAFLVEGATRAAASGSDPDAAALAAEWRRLRRTS